MMTQISHPTTVFMNADKAAALVKTLNEGDKDGWTYAVKSRVPGRFVVEITDENGDFLGYL